MFPVNGLFYWESDTCELVKIAVVTVTAIHQIGLLEIISATVWTHIERACWVFLPLTVLASVPRLTGSALVASVSKALTGGGEPVVTVTHIDMKLLAQKHYSLSTKPNKLFNVTFVFCCELTRRIFLRQFHVFRKFPRLSHEYCEA